MATVLSVGDIAIVQYNSTTTDSFTFVFTRDVEAGTVVNFTDNGLAEIGPGLDITAFIACRFSFGMRLKNMPSWLGLFQPSTYGTNKDVNVRDRRGHDGERISSNASSR